MKRTCLLIGLLVTASACASSLPPLLEEDGQYKPPREASRAVIRPETEQPAWRTRWRQPKSESVVADAQPQVLPAELTQHRGDVGMAEAVSTPPTREELARVIADLEATEAPRVGAEAAPAANVAVPRFEPVAPEAPVVAPEPDVALPSVMAEADLAPAKASVRRFPELGASARRIERDDARAAPPPVSGPYFVADADAVSLPGTASPLPPVIDRTGPSVPTPTVPQAVTAPTVRDLQAPPIPTRIVGEVAPAALAAATAPTIRMTPSPVASSAPLPLSKPFADPPMTPTPSRTTEQPQMVTPSMPATDASMTAPKPAPAIVPQTDIQRAAAERALAEINGYRATNGYPPLMLSERLSAIAQAHVVDLASRGVVSAQNSEGHTVGVRLLNNGYSPRVAGSVVAGGYPSFDAAFANWQQNPVERSRLLLQTADEMGFAIITDPGSTYRTYIEVIVAGQ